VGEMQDHLETPTRDGGTLHVTRDTEEISHT
jgi:hypothetical protein